MMLRFLLDGMEYAIVLPTLYGFLGKMNANIDYIGIIVAAYAFGGFISGPIFDKFLTDSGSENWLSASVVFCQCWVTSSTFSLLRSTIYQ
jgi:MFS family permease